MCHWICLRMSRLYRGEERAETLVGNMYTGCILDVGGQWLFISSLRLSCVVYRA